MTRFSPAVAWLPCLLVAALAGCPARDAKPLASAEPGPAASAATGAAAATGASSAHLSLSDLVPSPIPTQSLPPDMPKVVAGKFVFYEDFEHDMAKWQLSGAASTPGAVGWNRLKTKSCGGLYVMELGRENNTQFANATAHVDLTAIKPIDLKGVKKPQLQYDLKGLTRPYDVIAIHPEVRKPGGAWTPIGFTATARYPTVVTFTASLLPYVGGPIELRFHGDVKPVASLQAGMFLDDIHVVEPN